MAEDADVVLAIGTRLQDFTTGSWSVFKNPDVRFVAINTARWDAHKQQAQPVDRRRQESPSRRSMRRSVTTPPPTEWLAFAQGAHRRVARLPRLVAGSASTDGAPAYAQVIQKINELCDDDDYCLSAAGGLPGELTMGWRSKSVGSFDSEYGYSTMGYEIAGAWGAKMARGRRRRHLLGGRRLLSDDELGHLLNGDDGPQGHLHGLRQRRALPSSTASR